jgi:hypothetical protein
MKKSPNGRQLYVPRNQDPQEDLKILANAIAASDADLFDKDGSPIWITAGKSAPITPGVLRDICTRYVVTKQPRETTDGWSVEYCPYEPDEMTLRALLKEESGLVQQLPKAPGEPTRLKPQQVKEIQSRLAIGEPRTRIAEAYKVSVETVDMIKQLSR